MKTVMGGKEKKRTWSIIGECVTGASHIKAQKPCQDALEISEIPGIGVIGIMADGHGSEKCRYSDDGARIAAASALSIIKEIAAHTEEEKLCEVIGILKDVVLPKNIEREWKTSVKSFHERKNREVPVSDKVLYELYGTTLLMLFVTDDFIFAMQIGDGDILSVFENGETSWLIESDEQFGTETYSLCLKESWKYFKNKLIPLSHQTILPRLFIVSTDGYANSFVSSEAFLKIGKDYLDLVKEKRIQYVKDHLKVWLDETSVCGSGDDITFALVYSHSFEEALGG